MGSMTIQRSFDILELKDGATLDDAREAYRDIASVWHPDRFSGNPRLRHKAEQKLKEINLAYETAKTFLQDKTVLHKAVNGEAEGTSQRFHGEDFSRSQASESGTSRTERAAEMGTVLVLGVYSYVSDKLHRFMERDRP